MPRLLAVLLVAALALAVRAPIGPLQALWVDEVFSSTFAALPPWEAVLAALRFDLHPPLYYLQLSLWSLFGDSDRWLYLNSALFGVLAVIAVMLAAERVFDRQVALIAGLAMALSPFEVFYSMSLRMYAMLIALTVLAWSLIHRTMSSDANRRVVLMTVAAELALVYSYVLGVYAVFFLGLYGLAIAARSAAPGRVRLWLRLHTVVVLASLPAVGNALLRSAKHAAAPDTDQVLEDLRFFLLGSEAITDSLVANVVLGVVAGLLAIGLAARGARPMILALVLAPAIVMIALSYGFRPMWHRRTLAFTQPFVLIGAAAGAVHLARSVAPRGAALRLVLGIAPAALLIGASGVFLTLQRQDYKRHQDFRACAAAIHAELPDGGTVLLPKFIDFWAVNRYVAGPNWGSPLAIQSRVASDRWADLLAQLGPVWTQRLGLEPRGDRIVRDGLTLVVGPEFDPALVRTQPALLLLTGSTHPDASAVWPGFELVTDREIPGITLYRNFDVARGARAPD